MKRERPDRFDGDAHHPIADYCPVCGYAAPPGELSGPYRSCPSCGSDFKAPRASPHGTPTQRGATTWL